jgi:hypothetical protein
MFNNTSHIQFRVLFLKRFILNYLTKVFRTNLFIILFVKLFISFLTIKEYNSGILAYKILFIFYNKIIGQNFILTP